MTKFDPYQRWLGIPPQDQPPHFYRLLGLELFEEDPEIIKAAAENAIAFIQQNAFGEELQQSQRLLKDIEKVAAYLMSPPHKAKYDKKLKAKLGISTPEVSAPEAPTQQTSSKQNPKPAPPTSSQSQESPSPIQVDSPSTDSSLEKSKQASKLKLAGFEISYLSAAAGIVGIFIVAILLGMQFVGNDSAQQTNIPQPSPTPEPSATSKSPKTEVVNKQALVAKENNPVPQKAKPAPNKPDKPMPPPADEFTGQFTVRSDTLNQKPGKLLEDVTVDLLYQPGLKKEGQIPLGTFKTGANGQGTLKVKLTPKQQTGKFLVKLTRENESWERMLNNFPNELAQNLEIPVQLEPEYLNPAWIEQRLTEVKLNDLIAEYRKVNDPAVQAVASALELSQHLLQAHPETLRDQLQLRLQYHQEPKLAVFQSLPDEKIQIRSQWPTFNRAGGPLIRTILDSNRGIYCLAVTPDGKYAITGRGDRLINIWDISTGKLSRNLKGHRSSLKCLAVTPDGKRLVSGSYDKKAIVWDIATGKAIHTLDGHTDTVSALAITPDGKRIVTGGYDQSLKLWDLETGKLLRSSGLHKKAISSIAISPDGQTILSASYQNLIVSRIDNGQGILELKSDRAAFDNFSMSPDGKFIVSSGSQPQIWNLATGSPILNLEGDEGFRISCLAVSPNGKQVIAGTHSRALLVFDIATGKLSKTFLGHSHTVTQIAFLPDGKHFISGSYDDTLKLWSLENESPVLTPQAHSREVNHVVISSDGKQAVSAAQGELKVWDLQKGKLQNNLKAPLHSNNWISYLPDERFIISGSSASFHGWDIDTGAEIHDFKAKNHMGDVAVSPDGSRGITTSEDIRTQSKKLTIWDLTKRKLLRTMFAHKKSIASLAISADGKRLFSGSLNEFKVWDLESGELLHTYEEPMGLVRHLKLTSDGKYALTSGVVDKQHAILVWDLLEKKRKHTLKGHTQRVRCLAVSPDGTLAVSNADDKTIRLWDLIQGKLLKTYAFEDKANDIAIASDNRTLLVGCYSGRIHKLRIVMPGEATDLQPVPPLLAAGQGAPDSIAQKQQTLSAKSLDRKVKIINSLDMHFALIPAGKFMMGSGKPAAEIARQFDSNPSYFENERPQHEVQIEKPFYMGMHEVTIDDFKQFINMTGYKTDLERSGRGGAGWDDFSQKFKTGIADFNWAKTGWSKSNFHPVVNVSWNDAVSFCKWLSQREKAKYRLPTEAEWEYACRAGTTSLFYYGNDPEAMAPFGNIWDKTASQQFRVNYANLKGISAEDNFAFTAPVGSFKANPWSLYDMHGNVMEWCSDWMGDEYYKTLNGKVASDPQGPETGSDRVLRGGCWSFFPQHARAASRSKLAPSRSAHNVGFRVVLEIEQ
ncbi:Serine/threonine-protein kinase pkn1 [Gimesia alba]|uniref:Serine/threonine-protein kinase pkn1 n=1 Tax=Gimesia alba TaxID=2527973 RepID=A0A517RM23_9PLAN|nr:SUMF1/EgtB/PvdO family nonheme iron enzyme [Gimesia alba]QDT44933.1 Serine/threonine-protein kinase pkn1 [Gimesia alba]